MEHAVEIRGASLGFGRRRLWSDVHLQVAPGEFLAILGPNGSGKTSLLKGILGLERLDSGTVLFAGRPLSQVRDSIGYVPQQKSFHETPPLRARDFVGLGIDGHHWGFRLGGRNYRHKVDALLATVGAGRYGLAPVGSLSGGEQQRLRIAQALATDPRVLLCDEPLLSLDVRHQHAVSNLIARRCREKETAVIFVTHDIHPVMEHVDRVLYLVNGRFRVGAPDEVMTSAVLSELYGTHVDVVRAGGRIFVSADTGHCHDDRTEAVGVSEGLG